MNEIKVFYIIRPARYRTFIPEGRYPYTKTEASLPAMQTKWEVPVWKGRFSRPHNESSFSPSTPQRLLRHLQDFPKWAHSPGTKAHHIPGIIGLAAIGMNLIRATTIDTSDTEGFVFHRRRTGRFVHGDRSHLVRRRDTRISSTGTGLTLQSHPNNPQIKSH